MGTLYFVSVDGGKEGKEVISIKCEKNIVLFTVYMIGGNVLKERLS